jgi:hypothetical protein
MIHPLLDMMWADHWTILARVIINLKSFIAKSWPHS